MALTEHCDKCVHAVFTPEATCSMRCMRDIYAVLKSYDKELDRLHMRVEELESVQQSMAEWWADK